MQFSRDDCWQLSMAPYLLVFLCVERQLPHIPCIMPSPGDLRNFTHLPNEIDSRIATNNRIPKRYWGVCEIMSTAFFMISSSICRRAFSRCMKRISRRSSVSLRASTLLRWGNSLTRNTFDFITQARMVRGSLWCNRASWTTGYKSMTTFRTISVLKSSE